MSPRAIWTLMLLLSAGLAAVAGRAAAQQQPTAAVAADAGGAARSSSAANAGSAQASEADIRIQGEQRFRANCGRCHQSPHHFPPRMMATIIRHMRVRATLTDEDMRIILKYMEQ